MQSYYSVYGTRIHLLLDDKFAALYNRAQDAWTDAQETYKHATGKNWTGDQALYINWTDAEQKAFNDFADLMNLMIKLNGGSLDIREEDIVKPHLIKL